MLRAVRKASAEVKRGFDSFGERLSSSRLARSTDATRQASSREQKEDEPLIKSSSTSRRGEGFWSRHFGTDALLGSWCLLVASMLYALYGAELCVEAWGSPSVLQQSYAWGNAVSGVLFAVGSLYFVHLSYPEEMDRCATEALAIDVAGLSYVERTFTFNDMLIATWSFELACVPYLTIAIVYVVVGALARDSFVLALGLLFLFAALMLMACIYVWVLSAMPQHIQQNGGAGSSRFYDGLARPLLGCCVDEATLKKHLGTDLQAGGWLFFLPCVLGSFVSAGLVYTAPTSFDTWSFLVQAYLLAVGAGLLLKSMYPQNNAKEYQEEPRIIMRTTCSPLTAAEEDPAPAPSPSSPR